MDAVDREVTLLFDTKPSGDLIVCTDFTRFDQHFNRHLQDAVQCALERILTRSAASGEWLEEVFPIKYLIGMILKSDGEKLLITRGTHGMASGSGGTNVDETLAHRMLQHEAAMLAGTDLNSHSMCLGDDGILTFPGITVESVTDAYTRHGVDMNPSKQYASRQECVFLRRWYADYYRPGGMCRGVYSTYRALGRLRYLERFMDPEYWSPELVALRQLSIIENCKWHPLFHQFIDYCMERDKYRLGIDIPGFMGNLAKKAREANEHIPDFLGYTKTLQGQGPEGINSWAVVKYLKSRA
jgi:hypothetical protein